MRRLLPAAMIVAGLLLAWLVFLGLGEGIVTSHHQHFFCARLDLDVVVDQRDELDAHFTIHGNHEFVVRAGEGGSRSRWYRWLPAQRGQPALTPGSLAPGPSAAPEPVSARAARASSTVSCIGSRSARPVIHSALT